ncbi:MAG: hypothetical protein H8E60_04305 [Candidatus Marinimicrobia bacterium]|nr:hypothetical protein [Candidatus Neomarinimicrobiota bacterium]
MNCYEFELNLSDFIEGELKQKDNFNFKTHKNICNSCSKKLESMLTLISNMRRMRTVSVPSNFTRELHYKISNLDNYNIKNSWRFLDIFNLGLKPNHTIAFGLSIIMIITSIVYFSKIDQIPNVKIADFKTPESVRLNNNSHFANELQSLKDPILKDSLNKVNSNKNNNLRQNDTPPIKVVNSRK